MSTWWSWPTPHCMDVWQCWDIFHSVAISKQLHDVIEVHCSMCSLMHKTQIIQMDIQSELLTSYYGKWKSMAIKSLSQDHQLRRWAGVVLLSWRCWPCPGNKKNSRSVSILLVSTANVIFITFIGWRIKFSFPELNLQFTKIPRGWQENKNPLLLPSEKWPAFPMYYTSHQL